MGLGPLQTLAAIVDDTEFDGAVAYGPTAAIAFFEADRLAGQGLVYVDGLAAPFDLAVVAHPAQLVICVIAGLA